MLGRVSAAPTSFLAPAPGYDPALGIRPPRLRRGTVRRDRLVRLLVQSADVPLVLVRAPAGYGKTTLLSQWSERDGRPFVWADPELAAERSAPALVAAALDAFDGPSVLVLDGSPLRAEAVQALIRAMPAGSQVALAARGEPELPLGSLRAQGQVIEVGPAELAMTRREAAAMLSMAGVELAPADLAALLRHTEGWPAALYLAALSLRGRQDPHRAVAGFAGDDRLVADYLRDEVLTQLPASTASFLIRTSILGRLSGPICDAVLDSAGSGAVLRDLERSGIPLVPLDPADSEYRHHALLGRCSAPSCTGGSRRAAPSCIAAPAPGTSTRATWRPRSSTRSRPATCAPPGAACGRSRGRAWPTAGSRRYARWLDRFRPEQLSAEPTLALTAATVHLADGDRDRIEHWAQTAERLLAGDPEPPPAAGAAVIALRALVARDGLAAMASDAARAYELAPDDGAWRPLCSLLRGAGLHLLGDREGARRRSRRAPAAAGSSPRSPRCSASPSSR